MIHVFVYNNNNVEKHASKLERYVCAFCEFVCVPPKEPPLNVLLSDGSLASFRRDASVDERCAIERRSQPNTRKWYALHAARV